MDAAGDAIAVWELQPGTTGGDVIQAAVKPAGREWGPPATISGASAGASAPALATDGRGDAAAIWSRGAKASRQRALRRLARS